MYESGTMSGTMRDTSTNHSGPYTILSIQGPDPFLASGIWRFVCFVKSSC